MALGEELPYLLVHVLDGRLLVRFEGVAEEQVAPLGADLLREFDPLDVGEARVPVGQDRGEDLGEFVVPDPPFDLVEDLDDLPRVLALDDSQYGEVQFGYNDDQDRFFVGLDRSEEVHLAPELVYMRFLIGEVIEESTVVPADLGVIRVFVLFVLPLPLLVRHRAREVHLRHVDLPLLDVAVDGRRRYPQRGRLGDLVDGFLVLEAVFQRVVERPVLLRRQVYPAPRAVQEMLVPLLSVACVVPELDERAVLVFVRAIPAYEREPVQPSA